MSLRWELHLDVWLIDAKEDQLCETVAITSFRTQSLCLLKISRKIPLLVTESMEYSGPCSCYLKNTRRKGRWKAENGAATFLNNEVTRIKVLFILSIMSYSIKLFPIYCCQDAYFTTVGSTKKRPLWDMHFSPYQQTCNLCPQSCASPCWLQHACGGLGPFAGESCAVGSSCLCCTQTSSAVFHKLMRCWQWWLFHVVLWPRRGFICRRKYQSFVKASMREMSRRKSCWYVCFSHAALLVSGFRPWMPFSLSMYFLFVKLHALI